MSEPPRASGCQLLALPSELPISGVTATVPELLPQQASRISCAASAFIINLNRIIEGLTW